MVNIRLHNVNTPMQESLNFITVKMTIFIFRIYSPKVLVIPRNRWLRLNMTEKLFTGTLKHNQNKTKTNIFRILAQNIDCGYLLEHP